ncbi:MAG: hypothetical protein SGILL_002149 [Bacillariaceae sp.]
MTSTANMLDDCPICLETMTQSDYDHLLQCQHHCGFNMCRSCIESLLASSKDDFQEASDGNRHVKVYLHCPNCRSDLSHTIRDTLLLRKADEIIHATTDPSEWSPSQIRLEKVIHTPAVGQAIKQARKLEAEYLGRDDFESSEFILEDIEEWGFEADVKVGVHDSFRMPPPPAALPREEAVRIDPTLFSGLDFALSEDQRLEVTKLMTSGDPSQLADAAEILRTVAEGLSNPRRQARPKATNDKATQRRKSLARRSSVFQLIAEAEAAHVGTISTEEKKVGEDCAAAMRHTNPQSRVAQHRNLERELRLQADFQKRFPLPVRMPKGIEVDLTRRLDMEFVDYSWTGTVMDAYSKITIGFRNKVSQRRPNNANVANILGTTGVSTQAMGCAIGLCVTEHFELDDGYIALPQGRVLLSHTGRSGKQGAVRGDVVTHIDGKSVAGKDSNEVLMVLHRKKGQERVVMTLNAECSVAEALKRRAEAIADM